MSPELPRRFGAVGLDELVVEAALLTRVDRKYLVPERDLAAVAAVLGPRTRVLDIDGARSFAYASVYFDTSDHLCYLLTAQWRRRRFKLRTRSYVDTGGTFLEVKTRGGRGTTIKERVAHDGPPARLTAPGADFVAARLAEHGFPPSLAGLLRPSLGVRYRRSTLLLADGCRATIDAGLGWTGAAGERIVLPGFVIVESKSLGGASELDRALWRAGHRPCRISKFGTGTAALHPHLPRNKWARLLRGPFSRTTPRNPS